MKKSGLGDSPFFLPPQVKNEANTPPLASPPDEKSPEIKKPKKRRFKQPSNPDTTTPRYHDTMVSRYHETSIELVRKAVKEVGKEAATHRFTQNEKRAVADIIYKYKNRGVKTSENEIARISFNFIVRDYEENGENSILDRVIKALQA